MADITALLTTSPCIFSEPPAIFEVNVPEPRCNVALLFTSACKLLADPIVTVPAVNLRISAVNTLFSPNVIVPPVIFILFAVISPSILPVDDKLIVSCTIPAPSVRLNIPLTDNVPSPVIPVLEFICELLFNSNVPLLIMPFSAEDTIST